MSIVEEEGQVLLAYDGRFDDQVVEYGGLRVAAGTQLVCQVE